MQVGIGLLIGVVAMASGQSDRLYITGVVGNRLAIIQNGEVLQLAPTYDGQFGIAVADTVWISDFENNSYAREYDLDGYATRGRTPYESVRSVDATTDGEYVYELGDAFTDHPTVYRLGMGFDSSTREELFSPSGGTYRYSGITYDVRRKHLWVCDNNTVFEYDLAGTLLSSFGHHCSNSALAYEPSSDTIWVICNDGRNLFQYDKQGTRLQHVFVADMPGPALGAEFAIAAPCTADWDHNGVVDSRDMLAYLSDWAIGDSSADLDENGVVDTRDFLLFLSEWAAGC